MTPAAATTDDRDLREIHFSEGLPGFPDQRQFVLARWGDETSPFSLLRSVDGEVSFVVVPPAVFFPTYEPVISVEVAASIGIERAEDALLLTIVTVREPIDQSTANLLGPLVVNIHDLHGMQAVLDPETYPAAAPLIGAN